MSGRYVYEHRKKGDVDSASAEALDAGKKLLGYLAEQRRLGLAKTLVARAITADGSRVTARFIGELPEVTIEAPPAGARRVPAEVFWGFVTAPRMFGTAAANDGQLAFGANAQVILAGTENDSGIAWSSGFYDGTYVPDGYTGSAFTYKRAFNDGLVLAGNIDWTNADLSLAVNWLGPKMRSLSLADVPWAGVNTTRRGPCVYCDGQVLVDHSLISATEKVIGACVSKQGGLRVVYVAYQHDSSGNVGNVPKVYAAPVKLIDGKFVAPIAADIELLATGIAYGTSEHKLWPCLFFNQAATEGRMIRCFVDGDSGSGFSLHFTETVVTLNADGTASIAEVDRGQAQPSASGTIDMAVGPNMWNEAENAFVDDGTGGADPVPPGTYASTYSTHYNTWTAIDASNPFNVPDVVVNSGSYVYSMNFSGGPFPVAVDYEDDVPVYLYWEPGAISHNATYSASWTQDSTAEHTDERTYSYYPASLDTHVTHEVEHTAASVTANGNTTSTATDTVSSGRLYAQDKLGVTWLDLSMTKTSIESALGSASLTQEKSFDGEYFWDDTGSPTGAATEIFARSTDFDSSKDTDVSVNRVMAMLWWLDMRSKSTTYSNYTRATRKIVSTTTTASATDATGGSDYPSAAATTTVDTTTDSVTIDVDTRVMFGGIEVDAMTLHTSTNAPTTTITTGSALQRGPGNVLSSRYSVGADAHITSPEFVPVEIHGDTLPAWVQAAKDSFPQPGAPPYATPTDLNQEVDAPTTNPGSGAIHYSSFEFQPVETTIDAYGSFIYEDWAEWTWSAADRENTSVPLDMGHVNFGTWISHNGIWAFSMPDLSDVTHLDMSTPQYRFGLKGGASLDTLTGGHAAELFEFFWPLTPIARTTSRI